MLTIHRTALLACAMALSAPAAWAWEPTAPVELVVPAGKGGGADQMARFMQELVTKHGLMKQPLQVVNKTGDSGAEGLLDTKAAVANPHKLLISLSNLFTIPLATGVDFSWQDITPVSMLALDQFVLWVNAESPYQTAEQLLEALRSRPPGSFKLGGTGSKQEDQLIGVLLETAATTRIQYVALKGGGDVAKALAASEVDLTVNNPIEAEGLWRAGKVRPLCVFDGAPMKYPAKLSNGRSWAEIPTCMSAKIPVSYLMLRGIFMAPQVSAEQRAFYVRLFEKLRGLPEWRAFMAQGAFNPTSMSGAPFDKWLDQTAHFHLVLMREAKFKAH
ncbi:Bug family tripartite tricarboxylate transporter substrate binding protein [Roseateles oligotrophus]|uniref:Tripartite tricarboxylate transporter substrate binding protein n=1 Tax=Roseateles oligotrophus TaxID=1769250 RepID=A0ABT2YGD6_9BURK|nr:tripartite tricarboxylate transporter substrate-binding protein [Roseateles oligotrophus]MCV2369112.1 tripartite tricarboxylate transporter substrate binding protein [Roseateles oligotrophus]